MTIKKISRNSVGIAGEHAVLSQLALHGFNAGMTLGQTKNIDILVHDPENGARYELEVKTNLEARKKPSKSPIFGRFVTDWQMTAKHENISSPSLFYCFVHINYCPGNDTPTIRFFIVPSSVVSSYVRKQHALWLSDDPKRNNTDRRLFRIGLTNETPVPLPAPLASNYENNWHFSS